MLSFCCKPGHILTRCLRCLACLSQLIGSMPDHSALLIASNPMSYSAKGIPYRWVGWLSISPFIWSAGCMRMAEALHTLVSTLPPSVIVFTR